MRLSGSDQPDLRLTDDQVVEARIARPRRKRKRQPLERGMLDRGRNADRLMHELSNLLDGSLRNVGLAIGRLDGENADGSQAIDQLRSANHALQYMAELLAGWQRSNADVRQIALRRADTTLGQIIHEAVKLTRPTCDAANITLNVSIAHDAIDQPLGPLYPVLVNGLRNAVEAIAQGGNIDLLAELHGSTIEVRITDTGSGVADDLPRDGDGLIAAGTTTKGDGRGMGLAISRDIVRAMGGLMRLENRDDGRTGAVLIIRIPAIDLETPENNGGHS